MAGQMKPNSLSSGRHTSVVTVGYKIGGPTGVIARIREGSDSSSLGFSRIRRVAGRVTVAASLGWMKSSLDAAYWEHL